MRPVYRFTIGNQIFVFGMAETMTVGELTEFLMDCVYVKLHDGTRIASDFIKDIRVYDVDCPVGFVMLGNGQLIKSY